MWQWTFLKMAASPWHFSDLLFQICKDFTDTSYVNILRRAGHLGALWQRTVVARMLSPSLSSHLRKPTPVTIITTHVHNIAQPGEGKHRQKPLNKPTNPGSLCLAYVPQTGKTLSPFLYLTNSFIKQGYPLTSASWYLQMCDLIQMLTARDYCCSSTVNRLTTNSCYFSP